MANDFSGDPNCVALWKFDNNALDSKGGNDLTPVNTPTYDSGDKKEGTHSAVLAHSSAQYFTIADGDLDAGFPGKNGTSEQSFSICCWVKLASVGDPLDFGVVTKYQVSSGKRTWALVIRPTTPYPRLIIGYNGGNSATTLNFDTALSTGIWYHIAGVYDASDNGMKIRVWDDNAGALLDDNKEGTAGGDMFPSDAPLEIGRYTIDSSYCLDGKPDEAVIFNKVLTDDEIDAIRAGTYGAVTEKQSSDSGTGADAKASGNPVATLTKTETGGGLDVVAQAEAILTRAEIGAGVEALLDRAIVLIEAGAGLDEVIELIKGEIVEKFSSDYGGCRKVYRRWS
jgi:hypothetical protein